MKIGGSFRDCDKVQKSVRRDPHPGVPFCDAELPMAEFDTACKLIMCGAATVVVVICFVAVWVF